MAEPALGVTELDRHRAPACTGRLRPKPAPVWPRPRPARTAWKLPARLPRRLETTADGHPAASSDAEQNGWRPPHADSFRLGVATMLKAMSAVDCIKKCLALSAHWPVLNVDFSHRKIVDICRCDCRADAFGCRCDETIGLVKRHAPGGKYPPPLPRAHAFGGPKWCDAHATEKAARRRFLAGKQPPPNLFSRNRTCPGLRPDPAQTRHAGRRWTASEGIDEDGGIQQKPGHG